MVGVGKRNYVRREQDMEAIDVDFVKKVHKRAFGTGIHVGGLRGDDIRKFGPIEKVPLSRKSKSKRSKSRR